MIPCTFKVNSIQSLFKCADPTSGRGCFEFKRDPPCDAAGGGGAADDDWTGRERGPTLGLAETQGG